MSNRHSSPLTDSTIFTGFPASIGPFLNYKTESTDGAILLCDPLTKEWVEQGNSKVKEWGYTLADQIFRTEKATRLRGYFVVTGTHRTKRCLIHCWDHREKSVSAGVNFETDLLPGPAIQVDGHKSGNVANRGWVKCPDKEYLVTVLSPDLLIIELAGDGVCGGCGWFPLLSLAFRVKNKDIWRGRVV